MSEKTHYADMSGKTCLITGASSGIGLVTARELARLGARVVLLCRNREKSEECVAQIRRLSGNDAIELVLADFASQAQIRQAVVEILARCSELHLLVNNAGIANLQHQRSSDGIEAVFAVNHLAPFLITNLLLERLSATPGARIVNVASEAHRFGTIQLDDLGFERRKFRWMRVYGQSKLANILFSRELARRIGDSGPTVNSLHPGGVATGLGSNNGLIYKLVMTLARPFLRSPDRGAETSLYLSASPQVEGVTGEYFIDCKPRLPSSEARNDALARELWKVSEGLCELA